MALKKVKKKKGLAPGSVIYTGDVNNQSVKIHRLVYDSDSLTVDDFSSADKRDYKKFDPSKVHWYDIRGVHDIEIIKELGDMFGMHNLVQEDVVNVFQRPKFEDFGDGVFATLKHLDFNKHTLRINTEQVSIFFKDNIIISFQEYETDLFESIRLRIENASGKLRARGADYLAFAIIDVVVDNYFDGVEAIDEIIEGMEAKLIENEDTTQKLAIHHLRREVLAFRAFVIPVRELLNKFIKCENELIDQGTKMYLRDAQDHTSQVLESIDSYRDTLNGMYDLLMTNVSFKMNQVMKVLTTISTIFIPLTFLVGVYGMNFKYMPELEWHFGYYAFWAASVTMAMGLVWYFKRKDWF